MEANPNNPAWVNSIAEEDWLVYEPVLKEAVKIGIQFALGGAFALAAYTNHLRNTKDLDIYVLPSEKDKLIEVVGSCGMKDYYPQASYDRSWIYRSYCANQIVDVIWSMPNRRSTVDGLWLTRGPMVEVHGYQLRVLPAEELFWAKLYVLQRDRCDWPDILNILYHSGSKLDWEHLLLRVGADFPLLSSILIVFRWLCSERADTLPAWLWDRVNSEPVMAACGSRSHLLDTRPWFGEEFRFWPGK